MSTARSEHTATLLSDGRVLVAGGIDAMGWPSSSAEIYDPSKGSWTPTKLRMNAARAGQTATLLANGRVLVVGGEGDASGSALASAEVFDPSRGIWAYTQPMSTVRKGHTTTLLKDGRALTAGGELVDIEKPQVLSGAELLDLSMGPMGDWTAMPSMSTEHARHTATRLDDSSVLVAGGLDHTGQPSSSAQIFSLQRDGTGCATPLDCLSGFCANGVCCDQACDDGHCDACSEAKGAAADGTCTPLHPECSPFACSPATGECVTSCRTIRDCADGFTCDPSGDCLPSTPNQAYRDDRGCTHASSDERTRAEIGLGLLAVLATARRARRRPG
jgi:hypothetical protein